MKATPASHVDFALSRRNLFVDQLATIEHLAFIFFGMLLLLVFIYAVAASISSQTVAIGLYLVGMLFALCLAAAAAGGFLGFLFGIPRLLQRPLPALIPSPGQAPSTEGRPDSASTSEPSSKAAVSNRIYRNNTNLEDISDWVTKIIVGLGLVQAKTIYDKLWEITTRFKAAVPGVVGADTLFLLVCVAAALGGFLFFYLETRTRIVLLFVDAENATELLDDIQAKAASTVNQAPILKLPPTPASDADTLLPRVAPASKEDSKFLNLTVDSLTTADGFEAWASAQARAGNLQAANTALQKAITLEPQNKDLLIKLADTQALQGRWNDAAQALAEAEQDKKDDPDFLRRELLVNLYLRPPDNFNRAISIAEKLKADPRTANDPALHLWLAAAQGQRAAYYKNRDPRQFEDARDAALRAAQEVIRMQPNPAGAYRRILCGMLDPSRASTPAEDNDLEVFKGDAQFESLLFGP